MKKHLPIFFIAFISILVAILNFQYRFAYQVDFSVFYKAAKNFLMAAPLNQGLDKFYVYKYFYFNLFPILALAKLPYVLANPIFLAINLFFHLYLYLFIYKYFAPKSTPLIKYSLGPVLFLILFKFQYQELIYGQLNLIGSMLILLSIESCLKEKNKTSAWLFSLALLIKPYFMLFGLFYLVLKKYKILIHSTAIMFSLLLLSLFFWNYHYLASTFRDLFVLLKNQNNDFLTGSNITSFKSFFIKMFASSKEVGAKLHYFSCVVSLGFYFYFGHKNSKALLTSPINILTYSSILLLLIPLISPQGWIYLFQCCAFLYAFLFVNLFKKDFSLPMKIVVSLILIFISLSTPNIFMPESFYKLLAQKGVLSLGYICLSVLSMSYFYQNKNLLHNN